MKILTNALLFNLFASYLEGMVQVAEELPAAYDNFVTLLGGLPQSENLILKLRRLNYTKIELVSMQIASEQMLEKRHILYDVFIGKALSLLDTEIEMVKELFKLGNIIPELKSEIMKDTKDKSVIMLTWNAGAISSKNGGKLTVISVIRAFEDMFHLKINALYTKRGKVFDRCTDTTPFIDSLRVSYNRMLEKRLI